ncbi:hypothetical protein Y032_0050g1985 [Ancylostoma ceylanicum]|uniref:Uncharacterized protein n=1 Tax=Ancylostoma ceylanicum TaxID=53326 RepID=A0A016U8X0_9BILA|nr:hypothetical protein Y032_0050g1985 [Ancylostoma ceylanicum]
MKTHSVHRISWWDTRIPSQRNTRPRFGRIESSFSESLLNGYVTVCPKSSRISRKPHPEFEDQSSETPQK